MKTCFTFIFEDLLHYRCTHIHLNCHLLRTYSFGQRNNRNIVTPWENIIIYLLSVMGHPIELTENNLQLYMQKVKISKICFINTILNLHVKILRTLIYKNFLPDYSLHYHHSLMKALCEYYTPKYIFSLILRPKVEDLHYFRQSTLI